MMVLLLIFFLIFVPNVSAEIVEGKSSASSSVETNISGNGQVYTRIEVQVNDRKEVLEATKPGNYKLEVSSDKIKSGSANIATLDTNVNIKSSPESNNSLITIILELIKKVFSLI